MTLSSCSDNQFTCGNGQCLDMEFRCNGDVNCQKDNSDEVNCALIDIVPLSLQMVEKWWQGRVAWCWTWFYSNICGRSKVNEIITDENVWLIRKPLTVLLLPETQREVNHLMSC